MWPSTILLCVAIDFGDRKMSELEYGELLALMSQGMNTNFLVITSVMFAYVVAGHLVAAQLPKTIAICTTIIYCLFMFAPFLAYSLDFARIHALSVQYHEEYPGGFMVYKTESWAVWMTALPMLLGWLGSVYYVHFHVRSGLQGDT
jgi:hypothetical protein